MSIIVEFSDSVYKSLSKLRKKDKVLFNKVQIKLFDIMDNPEHYKPLRNVLAGYRRIHIGSFVLIYSIENNIIRIISLEHHDQAY